ncbi:MAG: 4Fe-4S binding protein [candidate division WOR-3 bacterium]|nr:4Fe-4S binding protein [candidate division WOR-3 bacterium]
MIEAETIKCKLCGGCSAVCPVKAILIKEDSLEILPICTECRQCIEFCPSGALSENQ